MSVPRPVLLLAAALSATTLAACGSTVTTAGLSGDAKGVAQAISNLQIDAQNRDNTKLCQNDLASSVVARLDSGGNTCAGVLSKQLNEIDSYDLTLASGHAITINGTTATAQVKDSVVGKAHLDTLMLIKEGSRWKISGLAG